MDDVKKRIEDDLGFPPPRCVAWYIAVKIFVRDKINEESLIQLSEKSMDHEKYSSIVGKVIDVGPEAYSDKNRFPDGPRCKLGDWICFKPANPLAQRLNYRGTIIELMPEDNVLFVTENPLWVSRC